MGTIIRRAVLPVLVIAGGLASLIYGAMFHSAPVVQTRETETTIDVPLPVPPPRPFGEASPFPGGGPMGPAPAFIKKTVKRSEDVTLQESEPSLIQEITFGGVTRLASGEIKRTYSGDKGPALCPT